MLNPKPVVAGPAKAGLDLITDEEAAIVVDNLHGELEIFLGWGDKAPDSLDWLGNKGGNSAGGGCFDDLFNVLGASHATLRVGQLKGAAVTVGIEGMLNSQNMGPANPPGGLAG